jgi:adenosylcobinamide-GDP ribazoletransferase
MTEKPDHVESEARRWRTALAVATRFLTRLPVAAPNIPLADAAVAFPIVGFGIGLAGGAVFWLALAVGLPPLGAGLIALAATVILTGALHEDGLADTADGLGGRTPQDSIRIMRDSGIGAYGVLAVVFSVGLRASALAALTEPLVAPAALIAAATCSRAAMPAIMRNFRTASDSGVGKSAGTPRTLDMWVGFGLAALVALVLLGPPAALVALAAAAVAAAVIATLARRRLGGYTGDVLGAVQQACEIAVLLAVVAMQ